MAELTNAGYELLRAYMQANYTRIVLYTAAGAQQLVLVPGDSRMVWSGSGNPRTLKITLSGADADTVGKTFGRIKLFFSTDSALASVLGDGLFSGGDVTPTVAQNLIITATLQLPEIP